MGSHLRALSESYPINTNMTGLRCFSEIFPDDPCALGESSLTIGRVEFIKMPVGTIHKVFKAVHKNLGLPIIWVSFLFGISFFVTFMSIVANS